MSYRDEIQLSSQDIASLVKRINLARTDEITDKTHLVRGPPGVPGLSGINGRDGVPGSAGQTGSQVIILLASHLMHRTTDRPWAKRRHFTGRPPHNRCRDHKVRVCDPRAALPPSRRRALGGRLARPGPLACPARSARRAAGEPARQVLPPQSILEPTIPRAG
jgi:hypothetical protein